MKVPNHLTVVGEHSLKLTFLVILEFMVKFMRKPTNAKGYLLKLLPSLSASFETKPNL